MSEQTGFGYDVFIAYEPSDEAWVRKYVQKWLEEVGLVTFVEYRDSESGMPKLEDIGHALVKSRHTVAVLTKNSFKSRWTRFNIRKSSMHWLTRRLAWGPGASCTSRPDRD